MRSKLHAKFTRYVYLFCKVNFRFRLILSLKFDWVLTIIDFRSLITVFVLGSGTLRQEWEGQLLQFVFDGMDREQRYLYPLNF